MAVRPLGARSANILAAAARPGWSKPQAWASECRACRLAAAAPRRSASLPRWRAYATNEQARPDPGARDEQDDSNPLTGPAPSSSSSAPHTNGSSAAAAAPDAKLHAKRDQSFANHSRRPLHPAVATALTRLQSLRAQAISRISDRQAELLQRFGDASNRINQATGYVEIEELKLEVAKKELELKQARAAAREAKEAHARAIAERATSAREVNDLLSRKSNWIASDVARFTELVSADHINEQLERDRKVDADRAEAAVEKSLGDLMRTILDRYHQEQVWSDKIRSLSTYGSLAITGINVLIFLLALLLFEPYKRRKIVREVEERIRVRDEVTAKEAKEDLEGLRWLLLQATGNLASWQSDKHDDAGQRQSDTSSGPLSISSPSHPSQPPVTSDQPTGQVGDSQEDTGSGLRGPSAALAGMGEEEDVQRSARELTISDSWAQRVESIRLSPRGRDVAYAGVAGTVLGGALVATWQLLFG